MELQMQYTYKGVYVSMLGLYTHINQKEKNSIVLCHNSKFDFEKIDYNYDPIWYTQLQGIKRFMKIVHELNEGIINIKIN